MIYYFAECQLDTERHALYRVGELISIEPKVFDILLYLIEQRGHIVSHEELLMHCWAGRYISTASLRSSMNKVRRAIGQRKGQAELIQTIPKVGYRFIGAVQELPRPQVDAVVAAATGEPATAALKSPTFDSTATDLPPESVLPAGDTLTLTHRDWVQERSEESFTTPPPERSPQPIVPDSDVERRQLTVLECALRIPEPANTSLDLEKRYEAQQRFIDQGRDIIEASGGHIVGFTNHGLVAYFGYPQAREDAARRAVRSGLRLIEGLQRQGLASSIGIDTGPVVIEKASVEAPLVSGQTPALASSLCADAVQDSVLLSPATAALVAGYFDWRAWPEHAATPMAYRVMRERRSASRIERTTNGELTAFTGRETELALLQERWHEACEAQGQVVLLSGEAGIGKSRLIDRLKQHIADTVTNCLECHSSPYHQNTVFYPLINLLQYLLQQQTVAPEMGELERLEALLQGYQMTPQTDVPPLAVLLSLRLPEKRYPPSIADPQQLRQEILQTLLKLLLAQAVEQPLLLIIEDLHWADPSTLELIEQLVVQAPTAPLLLMLSCRPDFTPAWVLEAAVTPVALKRFNSNQTEQMLEHLTNHKQLPRAVARQIVAKADGVPLYIEELTRTLLESEQLIESEGRYELNNDELQPMIPATLQDSLMARLDRLSSDKLIAQWGAALGREFDFEVLAAVTVIDDTVLRQGLDELVATGLVYQRGVPPQARYHFKHALVRDAAYQSLLKQQRRHIHRRIAEVLETRFVEIKRQQPELLARHFAEADIKEQAIEYWRQAGERSAERSAHQEVISHLSAGLKLLEHLPPNYARDQRELDLLLSLGPSLMAVKGQATSEVETVYKRADQLCDQLGETAKRFPALWGLWRIYLNQPDMRAADAKTQLLLALATETQDTGLQIQAHLAAGSTSLNIGRFKQAQNHMERVIALYDPQQHQSLATRYGGYDPAVSSLSNWPMHC